VTLSVLRRATRSFIGRWWNKRRARWIGRSVRISGYEEWQMGENSLILSSRGHFDSADYDGNGSHRRHEWISQLCSGSQVTLAAKTIPPFFRLV
jgi:hypothetical protein